MCGITGIFNTELNSINTNLLHSMNDSQAHRGPDDYGVFIDQGIGLGHRRLSIIDLAGGHQPLASSDNDVITVFNGEIYNYKLLRKELSAVGYEFKTNSDTEVLVYGWKAWGEELVNKLRGMFSFAIWDKSQKILFLARDRLGIKPLYYSFSSDGDLFFSSELKALAKVQSISKKISPYAIEDYFAFGYIPEPRSIYSDINKLAPSSYLIIKRGYKEPVIKSYWDISFSTMSNPVAKDIEEELICRLSEAVEIRLMADVPLGAFLSGGVDSSAIVAMMSETSQDEITTCSISFEDPKYNEEKYALSVAKLFSTNHKKESVDPNDYSLIDELINVYDEPYADSSAIPTYRVCELARKYVKVALSGDGGDENFAGYRRYRWHMLEENVRSSLPTFITRPIFSTLGELYPKIDWAPKIFRAKSTLQGIGRDTLEGYLHGVSVMPNDMRHMLYSNTLKSELQGYHAVEVFKQHGNNCPTDDPLSLIQYLDFKTYLPGDILTKVDRASMRHGLEVRVPILDHEFVDWVSTIPSNMKLEGREGKSIFKKSLSTKLPNDILYRQKKGFAVPLSSWFRNELRDKTKLSLLEGSLKETNLFDMGFIDKLLHEHQTGIREHSASLWALLMFEKFIGREYY